MRGRPSSSEENRLRLSGRHFLQHCRKSKPQCVVCTKREGGKSVNLKRTSYRCKTCVPSVALCAVPCFGIYPTKRDYRALYDEQAVDLLSQLPLRLFAYQIYVNMTW